jgi:hypothetical protein
MKIFNFILDFSCKNVYTEKVNVGWIINTLRNFVAFLLFV